MRLRSFIETEYLSHEVIMKSCTLYVWAIVTVFLTVNPRCVLAQSVDTIYTMVPSDGIGNIVVRIEYPVTPRYPEGAPVVVEVGTWFVMYSNFHRVNETTRIGAVTVSYLWPGRTDVGSGMQSDGVYDYGGPVSLAALKDVIRFAAGSIPDSGGHYIGDLGSVPILEENIGLFASSHAGVVATNVLAYFGDQIPEVCYLVGRENPTRDEMYPLEIGYFDGASTEVNKVRNYFWDKNTYQPDTVFVDYSTVGWYHPEEETIGRPYFAAKNDIPEHILAHDKTPKVGDVRYYSRGLTRALLANGALSPASWPQDIATPAQVDAFWPYRITVHNYDAFLTKAPDLKVMLVFSRYDHVQAADTKPHIHQAWDGFRHTAHLWVRMNPDYEYMRSINSEYTPVVFPDNQANQDPVSWEFIEDYGFPADYVVRLDAWLASVAEMADRVYMHQWEDDLDSVFFDVLVGENTMVREDMIRDIIPKTLVLGPNYPNPFNGTTIIPVSVQKKTAAKISIYNMKGTLIDVLQNSDLDSGIHLLTWEPADNPAGLYLCRAVTTNTQSTLKLILLK